MPLILYRYILGELVRVIVLTTVVLVTVIAFGATIKPLATGLLAPPDIAKYVVLAIVPMLQFALPFSAGFGATIVMHRMVSDNEVLAAAVSGVSYRRLLLPIAALGVGLALLMLVLVHQVIPRFWVLMQKTVEKDVTRLFQSAVAKQEAFRLGPDTQIFAEEILVEQNPPGSAATKRMWLSRVAAADLDPKTGEITSDVTARIAAIDFFEEDGRTYLELHLEDGYLFDAEDRRLGYAKRMDSDRRYSMPDSVSDQPKYMSLGRILHVRQHPDEFVKVIESKQTLASALRRRATWLEIARRIEEEHEATFIGGDGTERYIVRAERVRGRAVTQRGVEPVRVEIWQGEQLWRIIECAVARIEAVEGDSFGLVFNIELSDCRMVDKNGEEIVRQSEFIISGAEAQGVERGDLYGLPAAELLAETDRILEYGDDPVVINARDLVARRISELYEDVFARIAQRTALAVTALLLLLLGALLAIRRRESLPLTIYLLAFLPSIADILLISGGEQMIRHHQPVAGFVVMWSGNGLLAVFSAITYWRLSRN